eukprot:COSAG02_NODE_43111_length_378_cov_0.580645_1_plen_49_part_10
MVMSRARWLLAGELLGSRPASGAQSTDNVLDVPHRHGVLRKAGRQRQMK